MKTTNGLKVYLLGGFSMYYNGEPVSFGKGNQSRFLQLFQILMLYKDSGIAKDRLMEIFYGWSDVGDKNNSLNNLIYRLRKAFRAAGLPDEEYVAVQSGRCVWSGTFPVWVDVLELNRACQEAEAAGTETEKESCYRRACELYRGELLPQRTSESWVIVESFRIKKLYETSVQQLCELLMNRHEYQEAYQFYSQAAVFYPYGEWQIGQIKCLMQMERNEEALELYRKTVKLYEEEPGTTQPKNMLDYLCDMREKLLLPEESLDQILRRIRETKVSGAYYCDYPAFIDACRVVGRIADRSGRSIFLMSCTVKLNQKQKDKRTRKSEKVIEWLKKSICSALRRGDLCTRYSKNQFLILLTGMRLEDKEVIVCRILREFSLNSISEGYDLIFDMTGEINLF